MSGVLSPEEWWAVLPLVSVAEARAGGYMKFAGPFNCAEAWMAQSMAAEAERAGKAVVFTRMKSGARPSRMVEMWQRSVK